MRQYLIELAVVFVGVALAFAVENLREDLNDRRIESDYLSGFQRDLQADLRMLREQVAGRQAQLAHAQEVLAFFNGKPLRTQEFFSAYYDVLYDRRMAANRNTMDEVLNSGSLRLIREPGLREALLELYVRYDRITYAEEHLARDMDHYLYDTTFNAIPIDVRGPWPETPANQSAAESLLAQVAVGNGMKLVEANLSFGPSSLLAELSAAEEAVENLLAMVAGS